MDLLNLGNNIYQLTFGGFERTTTPHEFSDESLENVITKDDEFPDGNPCDGHKITQEDVGNVIADVGIISVLGGFGLAMATLIGAMILCV